MRGIFGIDLDHCSGIKNIRTDFKYERTKHKSPTISVASLASCPISFEVFLR